MDPAPYTPMSLSGHDYGANSFFDSCDEFIHTVEHKSTSTQLMKPDAVKGSLIADDHVAVSDEANAVVNILIHDYNTRYPDSLQYPESGCQ